MDEIVLIQNDRDRRTLDWLIRQVGQEAIRQAVAQLAGNRKPYLSNVAKVLGLTLPKSVEHTPQSEGRAKLAEIRRSMGW